MWCAKLFTSEFLLCLTLIPSDERFSAKCQSVVEWYRIALKDWEGDFLKHLLQEITLDVGTMTPGATSLHFHAGYLHFGMQTPDTFRALVFFYWGMVALGASQVAQC